MKNICEYYNTVQPFTELGFYIADVFMRKLPGNSGIKDKPYIILFDMKLDNFRYFERKRPIPCRYEILSIDTDMQMMVNYDEIDKLIASIENLFGELHINNEDYNVYAFVFGFLLRAPILGNIIFYNIYANDIILEKIHRSQKRIKVNSFKLKLLQIRQNYIFKTMHEIGYDFFEYNCCDFGQAIAKIYSEKIPYNIKRCLHEYIAMYTINISLCKGEIQNLFQELHELYKATKGKNNNLSIWCLKNIIKMTNDKSSLDRLNSELFQIQSNLKKEKFSSKEIVTSEVYKALYEISIRKDNIYFLEKSLIDNLIMRFYGLLFGAIAGIKKQVIIL